MRTLGGTVTHPQPSRSRSLRIRALAALAGGVAGGVVAAPVIAANPAHGVLALPVNCEVGKVVLEHDGLAYDLRGNCGVVVIAADDTDVTMPTARRLVVRGQGNEVVAKPLTRLVVRGHDNTVTTPTVRHLRLASPGSRVRVEGLLEQARLRKRAGTVTADQVTDLRIRGDRHRVLARRGYDAQLAGDRNRVGYRRLDELAVTGDANRVRVRRGSTEVRVEGRHNRIRVNRRG
jgi:hypothetical protein